MTSEYNSIVLASYCCLLKIKKKKKLRRKTNKQQQRRRWPHQRIEAEKKYVWRSSSSLMTLQTACGSLSFSVGVRFAWTFTKFFTLADGLVCPGCQWHFTLMRQCDGISDDDNFFFLSFDCCRLWTVYDLFSRAVITRCNKNHNNVSLCCRATFSAFDYVRSHSLR